MTLRKPVCVCVWKDRGNHSSIPVLCKQWICLLSPETFPGTNKDFPPWQSVILEAYFEGLRMFVTEWRTTWTESRGLIVPYTATFVKLAIILLYVLALIVLLKPKLDAVDMMHSSNLLQGKRVYCFSKRKHLRTIRHYLLETINSVACDWTH